MCVFAYNECAMNDFCALHQIDEPASRDKHAQIKQGIKFESRFLE